MEFSKGTLHYMKKNAEADKIFTLNDHVMERGDVGELLIHSFSCLTSIILSIILFLSK